MLKKINLKYFSLLLLYAMLFFSNFLAFPFFEGHKILDIKEYIYIAFFLNFYFFTFFYILKKDTENSKLVDILKDFIYLSVFFFISLFKIYHPNFLGFSLDFGIFDLKNIAIFYSATFFLLVVFFLGVYLLFIESKFLYVCYMLILGVLISLFDFQVLIAISEKQFDIYMFAFAMKKIIFILFFVLFFIFLKKYFYNLKNYFISLIVLTIVVFFYNRNFSDKYNISFYYKNIEKPVLNLTLYDNSYFGEFSFSFNSKFKTKITGVLDKDVKINYVLVNGKKIMKNLRRGRKIDIPLEKNKNKVKIFFYYKRKLFVYNKKFCYLSGVFLNKNYYPKFNRLAKIKVFLKDNRQNKNLILLGNTKGEKCYVRLPEVLSSVYYNFYYRSKLCYVFYAKNKKEYKKFSNIIKKYEKKLEKVYMKKNLNKYFPFKSVVAFSKVNYVKDYENIFFSRVLYNVCYGDYDINNDMKDLINKDLKQIYMVYLVTNIKFKDKKTLLEFKKLFRCKITYKVLDILQKVIKENILLEEKDIFDLRRLSKVGEVVFY